MQSRPPKITIKMGGKSVLDGPNIPSQNDDNSNNTKPQKTVANSSPEYSTEDEEDNKELQNQMVLYTPTSNGYSNPTKNIQKYELNKVKPFSKRPPEVGAFTVQCANCFKWRLIPDQEKYEVIRERISDEPFLCETTRKWYRNIPCDDPTDIEQDGTHIWAIDKPNIAQPPPGWKRLLRLRTEGSSKFADVYYTSPLGNKLRSLPDVERFLKSNPEHAQGISLAQFSFQTPRPLRENYVRKHPTPVPPVTPECLEPSSLVEPISCAGPEMNLDLQIEPLAWAGPEENRSCMPPYVKTPDHDSVLSRATKKAKGYDLDCL